MIIRGPLAIVLLSALALSLATNFIVVGFTVARSGDVPTGGIERFIAMGIRPYPPEIRRAIAGEALVERTALRAAFDDFRVARKKMFEAMKADPFTAAGIDGAFAEVRTKTDALQRLGQSIVAKALAAATPEARAAIKSPRAPAVR
jgi:hypothetical protein